jgi:hypothetical protein
VAGRPRPKRGSGPACRVRQRATAQPDALVEALSAEERIAPRLAVSAAAEARPLQAAPPRRKCRYQPMLERAAARTGLDPAFASRHRRCGSRQASRWSWNPTAATRAPTAAGLGQFLPDLGRRSARPGSWLAREAAAAAGWVPAAPSATRPGGDPARSALRSRSVHPGDRRPRRRHLKRLRAPGVTARGPADRRGRLSCPSSGWRRLRFFGGRLSEHGREPLLAAQVGATVPDRGSPMAGSAAQAHRDWLLAMSSA